MIVATYDDTTRGGAEVPLGGMRARHRLTILPRTINQLATCINLSSVANTNQSCASARARCLLAFLFASLAAQGWTGHTGLSGIVFQRNWAGRKEVRRRGAKSGGKRNYWTSIRVVVAHNASASVTCSAGKCRWSGTRLAWYCKPGWWSGIFSAF